MYYQRNAAELVVFDVDGTLLPDNPDETSGRAFWKLNERGVFHSSDEKIEELTLLKQQAQTEPDFNQRDYFNPMIIEFDKQMRGASIRDVGRIAIELADEDVENHLYPELRDEIEHWNDYGAKLAIVSGSPDIFIQALKRRLGFDMATGTRHYRQGDIFHTCKPASSRAKNKHLIVDKMLHRLGDDAIFAAAYGDTINDQSMLERAKIPVVVNPKANLLTVASERNWEIIYTQKHLTNA